MRSEEFSVFAKKLFVAFPSVLEWLREKSPDALATQAVWRRVLEPYSLAECDHVLERWIQGDLKPPAAYDRDVLAVCIKQIIERDRSLKKVSEIKIKQDAEDNFELPGDAPLIAPLLAQCLKLGRSGANAEVIKKLIDDAIPPSPPYSQPRYRCAMCLDRGKVEVWRNDLARAVSEGKRNIDNVFGSYMVACVCSAGDHFTVANQYWKPLPRYQPDQYCRWYNGTIDSERERLQRWLREREESKRHKEFEAFA